MFEKNKRNMGVRQTFVFLFFKLLISFNLKLLVMILVCMGDWKTHHNLKKKKKSFIVAQC